MAKKSFKDSPALQFLSDAPADSAAAEVFKVEPTKPLELTDKPAPTPATPKKPHPAAKAPETAKAEERERKRTARENAKYKAAPLLPPDYRAKTEGEPRSRRVQLLMRQSLHDALSAIAHRQHTSINHLLEQVLTEYAEAQTQRGSK